MVRITVIVEGQTEESFVKNVLAPVFWPAEIFLTPILLGKRGGAVNYGRARGDVIRTLKQNSSVACTTFFDYYALGKDFPSVAVAGVCPLSGKALSIEQAFLADIITNVPDLRADIRFIPYIQLHEYEGLLFSDPQILSQTLDGFGLEAKLREIREQFATPEDINDDSNTAPSKRILKLCPSYRKVIQGTQAAAAIGIPSIRSECRHFDDWLTRLANLGQF